MRFLKQNKSFLEYQNNMNNHDSEAPATDKVNDSDLLKRIQDVLDEQITPYLEMHGGGCELLGFDDGVVTLRLFGGCSGCPSSHITLFNGIVPILKENIPEVQDVLLG